MKKAPVAARLALASLFMAAGLACADDIKRVPLPNSDFPILQNVIVPPGATTYYFSGMLPDVSNKEAPKGSLEAYGDTETQAVSVFHRIEAVLKSQGLTLGDVIQMKVYLVGDPRKGGNMDFAGFQSGYTK